MDLVDGVRALRRKVCVCMRSEGGFRIAANEGGKC